MRNYLEIILDAALALIFTFLMFLSCTSQAGEYHLLTADKLDFKIMKFLCNKEPMTPDIPCAEYRGRTALEWDVSVLHYLKWRNEIHAEGTAAKYESVGWHFELVIPMGPVEALYEHHSRHTMDRPQAIHEGPSGRPDWSGYPVEDSYGLRLCFLKDCNK